MALNPKCLIQRNGSIIQHTTFDILENANKVDCTWVKVSPRETIPKNAIVFAQNSPTKRSFIGRKSVPGQIGQMFFVVPQDFESIQKLASVGTQVLLDETELTVTLPFEIMVATVGTLKPEYVLEVKGSSFPKLNQLSCNYTTEEPTGFSEVLSNSQWYVTPKNLMFF